MLDDIGLHIQCPRRLAIEPPPGSLFPLKQILPTSRSLPRCALLARRRPADVPAARGGNRRTKRHVLRLGEMFVQVRGARTSEAIRVRADGHDFGARGNFHRPDVRHVRHGGERHHPGLSPSVSVG